jgi:hypothetical protein
MQTRLAVDSQAMESTFFFYTSRDHTPFDGRTDKGIGTWSTIPEVERAYMANQSVFIAVR